MKHLTYQCDAYLKELDTEVIEAGSDGGRHFVVTSDTIFYPEGGGQPADRGTMGGVEVVDVQKADGVIRHFLGAELPLGPVHQVLDWDRRFDHMQQHTGQHLLTAVALGHFGWATTAFHLGPVMCDIELARAEAERLSAADETVVSAHWNDRELPFIQEIGKKLVELAPCRVALLTVGSGSEGAFLVVAAEDSGLDLAAVGPEICTILDGRGGGRAPFFQGKATAIGKRGNAVERLVAEFSD